jgi:hypothetical protein
MVPPWVRAKIRSLRRRGFRPPQIASQLNALGYAPPYYRNWNVPRVDEVH